MLIKEYEKDLLTCKVFSDRDSMGRYAAGVIAEKCASCLNVRTKLRWFSPPRPRFEKGEDRCGLRRGFRAAR